MRNVDGPGGVARDAEALLADHGASEDVHIVADQRESDDRRVRADACVRRPMATPGPITALGPISAPAPICASAPTTTPAPSHTPSLSALKDRARARGEPRGAAVRHEPREGAAWTLGKNQCAGVGRQMRLRGCNDAGRRALGQRPAPRLPSK